MVTERLVPGDFVLYLDEVSDRFKQIYNMDFSGPEPVFTGHKSTVFKSLAPNTVAIVMNGENSRHYVGNSTMTVVQCIDGYVQVSVLDRIGFVSHSAVRKV